MITYTRPWSLEVKNCKVIAVWLSCHGLGQLSAYSRTLVFDNVDLLLKFKQDFDL